MEDQYAALTDVMQYYRVPEFESSLTTLTNLNRHTLVSWKLIRANPQHFDCIHPEGLTEGQILMITFPNVVAQYEVIDNDINLRAVTAQFVKATLRIPKFYQELADKAFELGQVFSKGTVEGVQHVTELE